MSHYCGAPCSLATNVRKGPPNNPQRSFPFRCPNSCVIPREEEHETHKCESNRCPLECPLPDCRKQCESEDHFHAAPGVEHFCGDEHQCHELCEEPGLCQVLPERREQEVIYSNQHNEFKYIQYTQISNRLPCYKKIPPGTFAHSGTHIHKENAMHTCDEKCSFCDYYCTLSYAHTSQEHDTNHGNMNRTVFTAEDDEFDYGGHRFNVGDRGTFVFCSMYCKELGRHRHIDYCRNQTSVCREPGTEHISGKIQPNPDTPKDFVSHRLFWERTGFKDPYTTQELEIFSKCDHECEDDAHKTLDANAGQPNRSFCQSPLFHAPLDPLSIPPAGSGYISSDGHHFSCPNPAAKAAAFHILFVIDRSGSMCGTDRKPLAGSRKEAALRQSHNNRLGAVYDAVYTFMDTRITTRNKQTQGTVSLPDRDTISLVLFDHRVAVPFENCSLLNSDQLFNKMLENRAGGGTDYQLAITKAGELIDKYFDNTKTNIVIFLSDGECGVPDYDLREICKKNANRCSPLYLHTVSFGPEGSSRSLEQMAKIAASQLPANTPTGTLCCQFTRAIDEVMLTNHFTKIASSLRTHKPTLLKQ